MLNDSTVLRSREHVAHIDSQPIHYRDTAALNNYQNQLRAALPIVQMAEICALRSQLASLKQNNQFILQAGDCAECFSDMDTLTVQKKVNHLVSMAELLEFSTNKTILSIGRIAGQFAKPRSNLFETQEQLQLPSYRGDLINGSEFKRKLREPCPHRLMMGYLHAKSAYHSINQFVDSNKYCPIYTSHEALNLHYERPLTRAIEGKQYNLSTHCPWLGMRTALRNSIHVDYLSRIENPIAIKLGPMMKADLLLHLVKTLNPHNQAGKIILISRIGRNEVNTVLPNLIRPLQAADLEVLWMLDPMHGNTKTLPSGSKTRYVSDMCNEIEQTCQIHKTFDSTLCGIHLEVTATTVTECHLDRQASISSSTLNHYSSALDPRLNAEQAHIVLSHLATCL